MSLLDVETNGSAIVVTFKNKKVLDDSHVHVITRRLSDLIDKGACQNIVLDYQNVGFISSNSLIMLEKLDNMASELRLCNVRPDVYEVFAITGYDNKYRICNSLEEALKDF